MSLVINPNYSLNIEEWEGDCLPEVVAVLAGDFEMLVPFLLYERVVLDCYCVPHQVLLLM